jgi:zinc/manganese transport system substrate-binding protein
MYNMILQKKIAILFVLQFLVVGSLLAVDPLHIVSSTTDLAAIAQEIGGAQIEVSSLCSAGREPHSIEVLPSYMVKIQQADLYLKVGLNLDRWADELISGSDNPKLLVIDCSEGIVPLQDKADAEHGHQHEKGNPHYWLAPSNLAQIATNIYNGLCQADPENILPYSIHLSVFKHKLDSAFAQWQTTLEPYQGTAILTYHESWPYFARDFDLQIAGIIESKPGVAPSPSHLAILEELIRKKNVRVILKEPFYSDPTAGLLNRDTGIKILNVPASVGGVPESTDIFTHFDYLTTQLAALLATR